MMLHQMFSFKNRNRFASRGVERFKERLLYERIDNRGMSNRNTSENRVNWIGKLSRKLSMNLWKPKRDTVKNKMVLRICSKITLMN